MASGAIDTHLGRFTPHMTGIEAYQRRPFRSLVPLRWRACAARPVAWLTLRRLDLSQESISVIVQSSSQFVYRRLARTGG